MGRSSLCFFELKTFDDFPWRTLSGDFELLKTEQCVLMEQQHNIFPAKIIIEQKYIIRYCIIHFVNTLRICASSCVIASEQNKLNKFLIAHSWWIVGKWILKMLAGRVWFAVYSLCYILCVCGMVFCRLVALQFTVFYRCHSIETHSSLL